VLTGLAIMLLVLSPVLVPLTITGVHAAITVRSNMVSEG
jgi:hypothetical protein